MVKSTSSLHLRTFASYAPKENMLYVYLMNMLEEPRSVSLNIMDYELASMIQAWELTGKGPDDVNPIWRKCNRMSDPRMVRTKGTSITVLAYRIRKKGKPAWL
jgi:hypothetical protein